jgi:hypothetical protein
MLSWHPLYPFRLRFVFRDLACPIPRVMTVIAYICDTRSGARECFAE